MTRPDSTGTDAFSSTDSNRHARLLKHAQQIKLDGPLRLQSVGVLSEVAVTCETYGQLSPARDNAVLICYAISVTGRVPRFHGAGAFSWYNTPNVRFLSIADFEDFCSEREYHIDRRIALDTQSGLKIENEPNLNADVGIFVLRR
jgi:hypothetical protein